MIRFWRSEVKVTAGRQGGEDIQFDIDAGASKSTFCLLLVPCGELRCYSSAC